MFLSQLSTTGTVNYESLVHISKPDDLSQTAHGSSYKENLGTLATLLTKNIGNTNMSLESNRIVSLVYNLNFDGSGSIKVGDLGVPAAKFHIKSTSGVAFIVDGVALNNIININNGGNIGINGVGNHKLHIFGSGNNNTTTSFKIQNQSGTRQLTYTDDGDLNVVGRFDLQWNNLANFNLCRFRSQTNIAFSVDGGGNGSVDIGTNSANTDFILNGPFTHKNLGVTLNDFTATGFNAFGNVAVSGVKLYVKDTANIALRTEGKVQLIALQIGNAGLVTGGLYRDTPANIATNGDLVIGIKT